MKEELVSFETAKLLKEKGFSLSYPSACYYNNELWISENLIVHGGIKKIDDNYRFKAPTQSLAQKWLREKHNIYVTPDREEIGSDEWNYSYKIEYLPKDKKMAKRRCPEFITIYSYKEYGGIYTGAWRTHEEALEEGLKQGLMLIK